MTDTNLCIICKKQCRPDSTFCSDDCIRKLAQNALGNVKTSAISVAVTSQPSSNPIITHSQIAMPLKNSEGVKQILGVKKTDTKVLSILRNKNRVMVFEKKTGRCLSGAKAPTLDNLSEWLKANPTFDIVKPGSQQALALQAKQQQLKQLGKTMSIKKPAVEPDKKVQSQLQFGHQKQIVLINPQKQQPIATVISSATTQSSHPLASPPQLQSQARIVKQVLKTQVAPKILQPQLKQTTITSSFVPKLAPVQTKGSPALTPTVSKESKPTTTRKSSESHPRKQSLDRQISTSSSTKDSPNTEPIRINVKKTFKDTLTLRMGEVQSGPKLSGDEIEEFANATELEMFRLFNNDTGSKYKAKYRSLMFNIKDRKNATLFQKICDKTIEPSRLVRMNPDELASNELAQWRENENKHQLEMIKKSELDLLASTKSYVLKTHKGEEVIESKETDRRDIDPTVAVEDVVSLLNNSTVSSTSDSFLSTSVSTKQRLDKFEKMAQEIENKIASTLATSSPIHALNTSSLASTAASKKKEIRRSRSRSRGRHENRSSKSSKHKKHKSRERRSRSRDKDRSRSRDHTSGNRSRSRSRDKESKHRVDNRKEKMDRREIKKEKEKEKSKEISKTVKSTKESSHATHSKQLKEIKTKPAAEDYNLIDKILEASSSTIQLDEIKAKEKLQKNVQTINPVPEPIKKTISIESDQEPSSTVIIPTPPDTFFDSESNEQNDFIEPQEILWSGTIKMIDVASFQITLHSVSGDCDGISRDLPSLLDIVGRISPETVWDYITKIKKSPNKEILLLRFGCDMDDENVLYNNLYQYLHSRKRLGVIKTESAFIKDFYVFPLAAQSTLPNVLLPIVGSGFVEGEANKPDLLLGIVVKINSKRSALPIDIVSKVSLYFILCKM